MPWLSRVSTASPRDTSRYAQPYSPCNEAPATQGSTKEQHLLPQRHETVKKANSRSRSAFVRRRSELRRKRAIGEGTCRLSGESHRNATVRSEIAQKLRWAPPMAGGATWGGSNSCVGGSGLVLVVGMAAAGLGAAAATPSPVHPLPHPAPEPGFLQSVPTQTGLYSLYCSIRPFRAACSKSWSRGGQPCICVPSSVVVRWSWPSWR